MAAEASGAPMLEAADADAALEQLHDIGCTDGLPVVVPTPERVDATLRGWPGIDRHEVLGLVPPSGAAATVELVAVNAVMAGCPPAHLPTVGAAVRAMCQPAFGLDTVQSATHEAAILTIVDGDAAGADPPISRGPGALGPGDRAATSIGRALRLVLRNVGDARPGAGDPSTLGSPAKLGCTVAELDEESPFAPRLPAPLHRSAVTVMAGEGPAAVMYVPLGDDLDSDANRLLDLLATTVAAPGSLGGMGYACSAAIVLCPLHARLLADAGFDRAAVAHQIWARAARSTADVRLHHGTVRGGAKQGDAVTVRAVESPDVVQVVVAGGPGTYSAVFRGLAWPIGAPATVEF